MKNYKNILFINYGGIGDEILFLPTLKSAKDQFPNSKITLALEPRSKSIKNLTNLIDDVICVDIKAQGIKKYFNILKFIISCWFKNFDCVISSGKNPLVAIILFLTGIKERIGYDSKTGFLLTKKVQLNENQYAAKMYHALVEPIVNVEYEDPNIKIIGEFELGENLKKGEYFALHPGVSKMSISKNIFKCPKKEFWLDLIKGILNKNKQLVLLGTNDDKDLIEEILKDKEIVENPNFINYFKKTKNIMEMAFIMKNAKSVICVDSAPLHVAVCVNVPTFAIFGPTNDLKLIPKRENITLIKNDVNCRPCLWHKRAFNCETSECLDINPSLILDKIN
ncbi:MAG: glycosyltransferase family 9 protein [Candidatus Gastranaerophilales bacterium]|nr:glycosyltransferase family 9 protein [Candidatus Gastranaerophilales bacterium]